MMMTTMRMTCLAALLMATISGPARANFDVSISGLTTGANGGSFNVRATPNPAGSEPNPIGQFTMNMNFTNFAGGLGSLTYAVSNPFGGGTLLAAPGISAAAGAVANNGTLTFSYPVLPAALIPAGGQNLLTFTFGNMVPSSSFDVALVAGAFPNETSVGSVLGAGLNLGSAHVAAVPEASCFLLVGSVVAGAGGFRWLRRRRQAA